MGERSGKGLRARLGEIIFESTAGAPRALDVALMVAIVVSVLAVLLNSCRRLTRASGRPCACLSGPSRSSLPWNTSFVYG